MRKYVSVYIAKFNTIDLPFHKININDVGADIEGL